MAGNVAEWVADVYRPIVDDEFNDLNYYRGNVYTRNAISEDGTVEVLGVDEIQYDTLSNGKIVARNLPGEIATVPLTEEDTYLRPNFTKSDNRNFRDGDKSSSRYYNQFEEIEDPNKRMYNSPIHTATVGDEGESKLEYDKNSRTTLIDDHVRVYKGGSWRDRAYWLDPAQRRYFPEDMATDYIGFRNAMSRVGSKSLNKNKTAGN
jgi:gliding motility-associated lipoprotein GldJ